MSENLYILKAIAIVSAITAHAPYTALDNAVGHYLIARFARMGVFTFFLISGYFHKKTHFPVLVKKTFRGLVVPWLFLGTVLFFLRLRSGEPVDVISYINYIIGNGSTLYFCTVLVLLRLIFSLCPSSRKGKTIFCTVWIVLNILSLFVTAGGILPSDAESGLNFYEYLNPYLNVCNWAGIFALGMTIAEYDMLNKISATGWMVKSGVVVFSVVIIAVGAFENSYSYWSYMGVYTELAFFLIFYLLLEYINGKRIRNTLAVIGQNTLPLFLLHYPILALLFKLDWVRSNVLCMILGPLACVAVLMLGFFLVYRLASRVGKDNIIRLMTGIHFE